VAENNGIYLGSLDSKPEQQGVKRLVATGSNTVYAPSQEPARGYILFVREGSLMAQAFDARKLELTGEAVPIAGAEGLTDTGPPQFSASATGALAYRSGAGGGGTITQLIWFDRTGKNLGNVGEPGQYNTVALSPDGTRAAVSLFDPHSANIDLWVREFARDTSTRLTFDNARDWMATWSPDGSRIIFGSRRGDGNDNLYQKVSSGAGNEEVLLKSDGRKYPYDWSQDGRFLLYAAGGEKGYDLWVLPLTGDDRKPTLYLQTEFDESQARFSPDGHFVAYTSNASGKSEVYVQPFPTASGGKWQVSQGGGNQPRWQRDGKEIFYISADSKMMAVDVTETPAFKPGVPKALFPAPIWGGATTTNVTRYDVTADGKKFLINTVGADTTPAASSPVTVVQNWMAELKK